MGRDRRPQIKAAFELAIKVLRHRDSAGCANAFQPRGDIDAVAHKVPVGLFDHVAQMGADAKYDPSVGRDARIALDHSGLHFDCAMRRIDHTAEFSDEPVAGALDDPAMVSGDRGLNQIANERAQSRQRSLLVRVCEPAVADDIGDQDRRDFPVLAHGASSCIHLTRDGVKRRTRST